MSSKATNKLLKADNELLQAKLDDALAEINELESLVDYMEKETHNCFSKIDFSNPDHQKAIDWLESELNRIEAREASAKKIQRCWSNRK